MRPFGVYIHVPFCSVRCGYCDFNTYTATELGSAPGASQSSYAEAAIQELRLARRVLGDLDLPVSTVFFGGGTPTLLPPGDLLAVLSAVRDEFGLAPGAEVTTESNPDSVSAADLALLRAGGDQPDLVRHAVGRACRARRARPDARPGRLPLVVQLGARRGVRAGQPRPDLRYARRVARRLAHERRGGGGARPRPPECLRLSSSPVRRWRAALLAARSPLPTTTTWRTSTSWPTTCSAAAGFGWYEVSNWARDPAGWCRHNLGYWQGADWWGVGPGAHSHVGGVRWWNVKHPAAYAARLAAGVSPALAREVLDEETRRVERVLLETRLVTGLPLDRAGLGRAGRRTRAGRGRLAGGPGRAGGRARGRAVLTLTRRGRLLADAVVRALLP